MEIRLMIDEIELGLIKFIGGKYWFFANSDNIKKAQQKKPVEMKFYSLPHEGMISSNLPFDFLSEHIAAFNRKDLIKAAGIEEGDSEFEKLYKLAGVEFVENQIFKLEKVLKSK